MIEIFLGGARTLLLATSFAILAVALLRPWVLRFCGAAAVLRLWWIVPLVTLVALLPKSATPVWLDAVAVAPAKASALTAALSLPRAAAGLLWREMVFALWLAGALLVAGRLVWGHLRFLGGQMQADVGPAMVGALSPRLVLPADFRTRYTPEERKLILLHEYVHRSRRDGLVNFTASLLLVSQWFNPLVHWALRALCRDQEAACDAVVARRHPDALRTYAEALLKASPSTYHLPLVCRWQAYHPTVERIAMLKQHVVTAPRHKIAVAIIFISAAITGAVVHATGQPQDGPQYLVKFTLTTTAIDPFTNTTSTQKMTPALLMRESEWARMSIGAPDQPGLAVKFRLSSAENDDQAVFEGDVGAGVSETPLRSKVITLRNEERMEQVLTDGTKIQLDMVASKILVSAPTKDAQCPGLAGDSLMRFAASLPREVSASRIHSEPEGKIGFTGYAASQTSVSGVLRLLDNSPRYEKPLLLSLVKHAGEGQRYEFQMEFTAKCGAAAS